MSSVSKKRFFFYFFEKIRLLRGIFQKSVIFSKRRKKHGLFPYHTRLLQNSIKSELYRAEGLTFCRFCAILFS